MSSGSISADFTVEEAAAFKATATLAIRPGDRAKNPTVYFVVGQQGSGNQGSSGYCVQCSAGRFEVAEGQSKSQCDECPEGEFQAFTGASKCDKHTTVPCDAGLYQSSAGTKTSDRVCSPIPSVALTGGCAAYTEDAAVAALVAPLLGLTFDAADLTKATVTIDRVGAPQSASLLP